MKTLQSAQNKRENETLLQSELFKTGIPQNQKLAQCFIPNMSNRFAIIHSCMFFYTFIIYFKDTKIDICVDLQICLGASILRFTIDVFILSIFAVP